MLDNIAKACEAAVMVEAAFTHVTTTLVRNILRALNTVSKNPPL